MQLVAELLEAWCFKDIQEFIFLFSCFWLGLLFCILLWSDLVELVLVMECDPSYSMDTLYELCESWFWWTMSAKLLGE
jgi:hypothetical protein